ncbi:MAG: beta strand repeat-containing protein [Saccharofermentanales bacterium]
MVRTQKSKVLAIFITLCMIISTLSGLSVSTSALTAIEQIQLYAADDNAGAMTIAQLDATGVDPATTIDANLTAYQTAVAASTPIGTDSTAKIQSLINTVNLAQAILKIEGYNIADVATAMTIAELAAAGVTGAKEVNLPQYKTSIAGGVPGASDTTAEIQAIINGINTAEATTAIAAIEAYTTGAAGLTIDQLDKAGVTGLVAANLDTAVYGYKVAIGAAAVGSADTLAEIQAIINGSNTAAAEAAAAAAAAAKVAAIDAIMGYAADDNASALTIQMLKDAGVVGVLDATLTANLELYKTAIAAKTPAQVDTTAEIQAIVDGINATVAAAAAALAAALTAISGYAANDNADALTIAQLTAAGVTGLVDVNLPEYKIAIVAATASGADTTTEIQAIIDGVDTAQATAALAAIEAYDATTVAALTIAQLTKAGVAVSSATTVNNAIEANLAKYKLAIGAAAALEADTLVEVQAIITTVNQAVLDAAAAIAAIEAYDATTVASLTIAQLITAGVTGTVAGNLAAYKVAFGAAAVGAADNLAEIQAIVNNVNVAEALAAAIAVIEAYNDANNATAMTLAELTAAGVTGLVTINLEAYKVAVAGAADNLADTTAEIQTIINTVNDQQATILVIKGYAANDDASALTVAQLTFIGVTGAIEANLAAYKVAIAAATASATDTLAEIQTIISNVNAAQIALAIAAIEAYTAATVANLTIAQLTATGAVNIIAANLAAYKTPIGAAAVGAADEIAEIQAIINAANQTQMEAAVTLIQGYAANDDASQLTIAKLAEAGVIRLIDANLSFYISAIAGSTAALTDTTAKIQTIIDTVNAAQVTAAIAAIEAYTAATVSALTIAQLTLAGVTPSTLIAANLAAYKVAIGNATVLAADTIGEIQTIIDNVNTAEALLAAIAVITNYAATDNASALTYAQLTAAGVITAIDAAVNLAEYKIRIAAATAAAADTTAEISAIIVAANAQVSALATIEGYDNTTVSALTIDMLTFVGVTGTLALNLAAYRVAIGAALAGAADTTAELQAIINTVNTQQTAAAIAAISGYAANDDASLLTIDRLVVAGVTGAILVNLGSHNIDTALSTGYIGAIERATAAGTDTIAEIQALINNVNLVLSSATLSGVNVGTVVGTVPAGSTDSTFVPTMTVEISSTVTAFLKTNFTTTGNGVVSIYMGSDFTTGLVGAEGVAIVDPSTTIYVKVVSANGISTKYYKVILNVVNPTAKYAISNTEFEAAGSNFVATVTLERGQAAMLSNPKLLLIITLADGETQVFLQQNAIEGENEVVVGAGVSSVSVVLVNGYVDWEAGNPVAKSAYVTIDVPTEVA